MSALKLTLKHLERSVLALATRSLALRRHLVIYYTFIAAHNILYPQHWQPAHKYYQVYARLNVCVTLFKVVRANKVSRAGSGQEVKQLKTLDVKEGREPVQTANRL